MSGLAERRILLGVTGGIAAYKAAEFTRLLTGAGAQVRVVMTRAAQDFVGALTFQALSGDKVHTDLLDPDAEAAMGHIELARWADLIVIAPASADWASSEMLLEQKTASAPRSTSPSTRFRTCSSPCSRIRDSSRVIPGLRALKGLSLSISIRRVSSSCFTFR
jgi:hypothetical protein